jgi:nucleotide-binding universal stress UspA family protein
MIRRILFPVDFSSSCLATAPFVKRAAAIFGAEVTLVHVCDLSSHNGFELFERPATDIAREHWSLALRKLELFLESDFPPANSRRVLLSGYAADLIAETAKNFDLIMMATHAGRFRRLLLGSTTAKVLNDTDCPVWTTEHAETIVPRSLEHRKWVCAVGLSADSERVFRYAQHAALVAKSDLSLLHVIESSKVHSEAHGPSNEVQRARQHIADLQRRVGSKSPVRIASGPIRETLLDQVRQAAADVFVIGRGLHPATERLPDLSYSLVRDSPCPVVSV